MEETMEDLTKQKRELRRRMKQKIAGLPKEYYHWADEEIFRRAVSLPEYQKAKTVFCFVGTEGEINTTLLLEKILYDGKRLGVPLCREKGVMEVREIHGLDELCPGAYGIPEPKEQSRRIEAKEIDLAFIPYLTCGKNGTRLGHGGGYYDRYLAQTDFTRAALCRSRLMGDQIPAGQYDCVMDLIVSEEAVCLAEKTRPGNLSFGAGSPIR